MSRSHFANDSDDDMEEVPSQFETGTPTPYPFHETDRYQPNAALTLLQHYYPPKNRKINSSDAFLQKHEEYQASRLKKIKDIKQEQELRVMADCTFKPHINKTPNKSPRNLQQFIESQQKHLTKTKEKKQQLKQRLQEDNKKIMTFSPQINRKHNRSNKENVHSRLYKQKDKGADRSKFNQSYSHVPKITKRGQNLVRNMPVNELLYLDAQRRAEKYFQPVQSQTNRLEKHYLHDKYVAQRFLKNYKTTLDFTQLSNKMVYNQDELITIFKDLGYVSPTPSPQERKLTHDCFSYLSKLGVTQINVYVFLLALGGIYNVDLNNKEITSALVIDEDEGKRIHQHFDLLFRNKLYSETLKKSKNVIEQTTQRYSVSPQNKQMADNYREKMIQRTNKIFEDNNIGIKIPITGLSHEDLLVIYNLGRNLQKETLKKNKSNEQDPQCTFQPNASKHPLDLLSKRIGEDKCKQLYQEAKMKQQESRLPTFRSFDNKEQNNFFKKDNASPLNKSSTKTHSKTKSNVRSYLQIKDVDKTLSRMVMGRRQRQQKLELQERGEPSCKRAEKQKLKTLEYSLEQPENQLVLDADVLVNNVKKKIYIFKKDQNRIQEVVEDFAQECDLDPSSQNLLYERLMEAIDSLRRDNEKS